MSDSSFLDNFSITVESNFSGVTWLGFSDMFSLHIGLFT